MSNIILTLFSVPNMIKYLHKYIFKTIFSYDVIYILQVFTSLLVGSSNVLYLTLKCRMYVGRIALPNKNPWRRKHQTTCGGTQKNYDSLSWWAPKVFSPSQLGIVHCLTFPSWTRRGFCWQVFPFVSSPTLVTSRWLNQLYFRLYLWP